MYKTVSVRIKRILKKSQKNKLISLVCLVLLISLITAIGFLCNRPKKADKPASVNPQIVSSQVVSQLSSTPSTQEKQKYYIKQGKKKILVDKTQKKTCYLTFDDGPSNNTLKILDILKENDAKATFFIVGTSKIEYLDDIYKSGNGIGIHCYNHDYSKIYSSVDRYVADFDKANKLVEKYTGKTTNIFRFPGGSSNTISKQYCNGIMSALTKKMPKKGLYYFDWNVDSGDAVSNSQPATQLIKNIKNGIIYEISNGKYEFKKDICILMHDAEVKKSTVEALPQMIKYLRKCGYEFEVLGEDSAVFHHGVNN